MSVGLRQDIRSSHVARWRRRGASALVMIVAIGWPAAALPVCVPSPLPADTPVALVLSGGGAKGAYEAGVATALLRRGAPTKLVPGSSAAALNAALVADGRVDRLQARWRDLTREQVYTL